MCNSSADAIDKAILSDLAKGVKVEPTYRYGNLVNTIVAAVTNIRQKAVKGGAIYNDIEFYAIGYGQKDGDAEFSRLLSTEYYLKEDVDKILAELCENHKKESESAAENWNRYERTESI